MMNKYYFKCLIMIEGSISYIGYEDEVREEEEHYAQEPVILFLIEEGEWKYIEQFRYHGLHSALGVHPKQ